MLIFTSLDSLLLFLCGSLLNFQNIPKTSESVSINVF